MLRRMPRPLLTTVFCLLSAPGIAQTTLSQNSGINSADTWVVMDVTAQTKNVSITTSSPVYNPTTKTTSSTLSVAPVAQSFHIEAGYDSSGGLVMNLRPGGTAPNPYTTDASAFGFIRVAGGQVTVFDQTGKPMPMSLPSTSI